MNKISELCPILMRTRLQINKASLGDADFPVTFFPFLKERRKNMYNLLCFRHFYLAIKIILQTRYDYFYFTKKGTGVS